MPTLDPTPARRSRRAAFPVVEVARLCGLSRSRFYDLIDGGAFPPPVYDLRTRRPFYTAELAARCMEVRETCTGIDGRYVMFYARRVVGAPQPPPHAAAPARRRQPPPVLDPVTREMMEALRAMGVTVPEADVVAAIRGRCPQGLAEDRFERDLLALYGDLRRPIGGGNAPEGRG